MATLLAFGLGAAFTLCGTIAAVISFDAYRDGEETQSWTATSGRVLSSTVDEKRRTTSDGPRVTYAPVVRYEYTVEGVRYEGSRIRARNARGDAEWANERADRFPQGAETTVYYDPDSPEDAVLLRGSESDVVYVGGAIGGLFVVVGLVLLGRLFAQLRRRRRGDS